MTEQLNSLFRRLADATAPGRHGRVVQAAHERLNCWQEDQEGSGADCARAHARSALDGHRMSNADVPNDAPVEWDEEGIHVWVRLTLSDSAAIQMLAQEAEDRAGSECDAAEQVGELVDHALREEAARRMNTLDGENEQESCLEATEARITEINNAGLRRQIETLIEQIGLRETREAMAGISPS